MARTRGVGRHATLAACCLFAGLLAGGNARATELRDGDEYTVNLRDDALVCLRKPVPAAVDPACDDLLGAGELQEDAPTHRLVAAGAIRVPDGPSFGVAIVSLVRITDPGALEPATKEQADVVGVDSAAAMRDLIPTAHLRRGSPDTQLWTIDGRRLVRVSIDLEGVPAPMKFTEHLVSFTAWTRGGAYTVGFMSNSAHAAVIDTFANDSAATIRVLHPGRQAPRPWSPSATRAYWVTYYGLKVIFLAAAVGIAVYLVRRRRRRAAEEKPTA
jgi:hypothetical protein